MKYTEFDERRFRHSVQQALKSVERILQVHRNPRLAEDVEHSYQNKYDLANILTNTLIISQMNILEQLGITAETLKVVKEAHEQTKSTMTLRFQAAESCTFLKEQTVTVPLSGAYETEEDISTTSGGTFFGSTKKSSISRMVNQIKEYHWKVEVYWELTVFAGTNGSNTAKTIQSRTSSAIIVIQSNKTPPLSSSQVTHPPIDLPLNWLLKMIDIQALRTQFAIDTQQPTTRTPYRNKDIERALDYTTLLMQWAEGINEHFQIRIEKGILNKHNPASSTSPSSPQNQHQTRLRSINASEIFCPIQPLFEDMSSAHTPTNTTDSDKPGDKHVSILSVGSLPKDDKDGRNVLLWESDIHKFLNEQIRTMLEASAALHKSFPAKMVAKVLSTAEATIFLLCLHMQDLVTMYIDSVGYIETMLQDQLIAAIGKRIQPEDMDQFVKFHNARLLQPPPAPFCFAIRRDINHDPDGHVSIESERQDGKKEPIDTVQRLVTSTSRFQLPLSATTTCELTGSCYLHGWVQHRFEMSHKSYQLIARARQFSCFILVIGTMVGPNRMDPSNAIIVQNKDELIIPLILNDLPTPKEFKDAIKSLSPEQQDFCKAFRCMQLESSVFGLCVIQVKPQMETLLGLPKDALLKEMKLTQELMELFVEYQIPSDLLSYDGSPDVPTKEKVAGVKGNVEAVMDVIGTSRKKQLEDAAMRADIAVEERIASDMNRPSSNDSVGSAGSGGYGGKPPEASKKVSRSSTKSRRLKSGFQPVAGQPMALARHAMPTAVAAPHMAMAMAAPAPPVPVAFAVESVSDSAANDFLPESAQLEQMTDAPFSMEGSLVNQQSVPTSNESLLSEGAVESCTDNNNNGNSDMVDFTLIPKQIDLRIDKSDIDGAIRSTIIKVANARWTRHRQANLLTKMKKASTMYAEEIKNEKNKAVDLLEALSRSGSLPIACSELHVIVSVTHCFDNDVMGTVVQDNINPIEKLEKPTLLMASTIHGGVPVRELLNAPTPQTLQRLKSSLPVLFRDTDISG